jgi:hypothetical protein
MDMAAKRLIGPVVLSVFITACAAPAAPSPTPSAGATPSPAHSAPLTPSTTPPPGATPPPTPSAEPTVIPTASPNTEPTPTGWIGPERISTRAYEQLSLVIDNDGIAHAAAELNDGIFYLTNASGSWTRERVSTPVAGGSDRNPSMTYDADEDYLALSFTRYGLYECYELGCYPANSLGIYVVTNYSGTWSAPFAVTGSDTDYHQLRAGRGQLHLAYEALGGESSFVHHATDSSPGPTWVDVRLAEGHSPSLQVGRDGLPRIAFNDDGVFFATASSTDGPFSVERVPAIVGWPELLLGEDDVAHIVFTSWEDPWSIMYTTSTGSGWSEPELIALDEIAGAAAVDGSGALHLIYDVYDTADESDEGLWYATNRAGSFEHRQLDQSTRVVPDGAGATSAIAVDRAGRAHFLFTVPFDDSRAGLYYAIGPSMP